MHLVRIKYNINSLITNRTMKPEQIEQRLQDIKNEIHSLDNLRDAYDDTNIHEIEEQVDILLMEKQHLSDLLDSCFDELIGL